MTERCKLGFREYGKVFNWTEETLIVGLGVCGLVEHISCCFIIISVVKKRTDWSLEESILRLCDSFSNKESSSTESTRPHTYFSTWLIEAREWPQTGTRHATGD